MLLDTAIARDCLFESIALFLGNKTFDNDVAISLEVFDLLGATHLALLVSRRFANTKVVICTESGRRHECSYCSIPERHFLWHPKYPIN